MGAYTALTAQGTSTREASALTGVPRSTATRRQQRPAPPTPREVEPANRLSCAERAAVLAVNRTGFDGDIDYPEGSFHGSTAEVPAGVA